jgi:hypothetical protein
VDPRRLRIGECFTGLAGAALLVFLFRDWYEAGGAGHSGWESFAVVDVLLAIVALMAIGVFVMAIAHATPAVSLAIASLLVTVGTITTIVLLYRVISPPDLGVGDTERSGGLWLGLAACVACALGALATMRDERFPAAAKLDVPVETLPVPPPEGGTA